ncbi:hypothetical protein GCM10029963_28560 [Micromonospora andamanensis]|nr:hypothetical protein Vwe01_18360 [Micromonospora andamanensis]
MAGKHRRRRGHKCICPRCRPGKGGAVDSGPPKPPTVRHRPGNDATVILWGRAGELLTLGQQFRANGGPLR